MNKQQRFFFQKINPHLAITIIIILSVFVGAETYWLSKSVSSPKFSKDILPPEKSTKDPRLLEKEAVIQALLREDARKREEALKNPDKIEELSNWTTYSYTTYGTSFTFKYPRTYIVKVGGEDFVRVGEDNKIRIFPPGFEDNSYVHIMIGFLPFSKPEEFSILAGTSTLYYDQNTNQWIVDGSPICIKPTGYFGTQNLPYYYVGSGKTDHPSEYVVILPQGLLYFSGSNHIEVGLDDILNTFTLDHPESVIKARCD